MNLFINSVSTTACLIIFNNNFEIINKFDFEIKWNESSLLIPNIDNFLIENKITYKDLENIVVVNWPWSFTWVRTTVLAANSINYIIRKNMTELSFFELFDTYPIIKSSSKRDCFIQFEKGWDIEIIENSKIEEILNKKSIKTIYWHWTIDNIEILENIDYINIIKKIKLDNKKQISPLYIKKPNIC